jgi:hypothetical protein
MVAPDMAGIDGHEFADHVASGFLLVVGSTILRSWFHWQLPTSNTDI